MVNCTIFCHITAENNNSILATRSWETYINDKSKLVLTHLYASTPTHCQYNNYFFFNTLHPRKEITSNASKSDTPVMLNTISSVAIFWTDSVHHRQATFASREPRTVGTPCEETDCVPIGAPYINSLYALTKWREDRPRNFRCRAGGTIYLILML